MGFLTDLKVNNYHIWQHKLNDKSRILFKNLRHSYSIPLNVSSLTPMPEQVFNKIDDVRFSFLWQGKDKIKRGTVLYILITNKD